MAEIPRARTQVGIFILLAASALGTSTSGQAQTPDPCAGVDDIGAEPGKPLSAQRVINSVTRRPDGTEQRTELVELVARDSLGRIRLEQRAPAKPGSDAAAVIPNEAEGKTTATTKDVPGTEIKVYDFRNGKMVWLLPDRQVATVTESCVAPAGESRPYSFFYSPLAENTPLGFVFEDLGYKGIEGFRAHGFRRTQPGVEPDGHGHGNPNLVVETWVSDDLAVMLLRILRANNATMILGEGRTTISHIKREEPDPSLFEMPPNYVVSPAPGETPFVTPPPKAADQQR